MGYNLFQDMGALIEATEFDFGLKAQVHDFPFRGTSMSHPASIHGANLYKSCS